MTARRAVTRGLSTFSIQNPALTAIQPIEPQAVARPCASFTQTDVGVFSCDLGDESLSWNPATYDLFGLETGSRIDRRMTLAMYTPQSRELLQQVRSRAIATLGGFSLEAEIEAACGTRRWIRISASVEAHNGRAMRLHGIKQDITRERLHLQKLERMAYTDPVTGLGNRAAFQGAFLVPERETRLASPVDALVLFDLDRFKVLNDTHGHLAGDAGLARFATRLRDLFPDALLLARIGGDEFAMLLGPGHDAFDLRARLHLALRALGQPFDWEGRTLSIHASVGLAMASEAASPSPHDLVRLADADLYHFKAARPYPPR